MDGRLRSTNVMRPLSKSYGVISTRTRSPTFTQIRALRILPHTVANISCPFSNFTRNIVFGNLSSTVPVKTMTSSFAICAFSLKLVSLFSVLSILCFLLDKIKLFFCACTKLIILISYIQ